MYKYKTGQVIYEEPGVNMDSGVFDISEKKCNKMVSCVWRDKEYSGLPHTKITVN